MPFLYDLAEERQVPRHAEVLIVNLHPLMCLVSLPAATLQSDLRRQLYLRRAESALVPKKNRTTSSDLAVMQNILNFW